MPRAAILLALFASACAAGTGAPISYGGAATEAPVERRQEPTRRQAAVEYAAPRAVTPVQAQAPAQQPDWAAGEGTPLSTYALQPGEAQPYDPAHLPRSHRVTENESLYDIATRYQVPLRALIDQNHLDPPYALTPGTEIQLPPPRFHRVARGERFEDIARQYNVDLRSLALLNRMQPPYNVRSGQQIVLPAMARENLGTPAAETATAPSPVAGDRSAVQGHFSWPLRGEIVARFGAQPGGARLDGIEIAGREGDRITAAGEGDVVYAGSDLPAYGTLVLVRHSDGYVTAYGFARRALVREGQHVRTGEAIAELGPRPDGHARLLFQVRRGSEAVDPQPLLGR
ncbi:peptidoglycan DD-metalloendopeptidase family protein [Terricaulis sp.]|uniref:peptidoglycan DD-metalloendopeptidase family protein n=1 Tax=Terricaulis sp. TaxID=2768686 RepID=UPI003784066D